VLAKPDSLLTRMALVVKAQFLSQPTLASPTAKEVASMMETAIATPEPPISTDSDYWDGEMVEASTGSMTVEAVTSMSPDISEDSHQAVQQVEEAADPESDNSAVLLQAWSSYHHCSRQINNLERLAKSLLESEQCEQQQQLVSSSGRVPLAQRPAESAVSLTAFSADGLSASNSVVADAKAAKECQLLKKKRKRHSWCPSSHRRRQRRSRPHEGKQRLRNRSLSQSSSIASGSSSSAKPSLPRLAARREISTPSWKVLDSPTPGKGEVDSSDWADVEDLSNAAYAKRHRRKEAAERRIVIAIPTAAAGHLRGRRSSISAVSTASSNSSGSSSSSTTGLRRSLPNPSAATAASGASACPPARRNPGYKPRRFPLDEDPV
ncbi:hypothetical protein BOX15_Mlig017643g1, partial [Macrostomum lignano]